MIHPDSRELSVAPQTPVEKRVGSIVVEGFNSGRGVQQCVGGRHTHVLYGLSKAMEVVLNKSLSLKHIFS